MSVIEYPVGWLLTSTPWKKVMATVATVTVAAGLSYGVTKIGGGGGGQPPPEGSANVWVTP